jgi:hypothetical protein
MRRVEYDVEITWLTGNKMCVAHGCLRDDAISEVIKQRKQSAVKEVRLRKRTVSEKIVKRWRRATE